MTDRVVLRSGSSTSPPSFMRQGELAYSPGDLQLWVGDATGTAPQKVAGVGIVVMAVGADGLPSVGATQPVIQAGGTGTDYSANTATAITAAQATTLLATIPATATRAFVEVQNQSAGTLSLVRDDGAGANQTLILLAPGSGAGAQGGGWSSATFKGRVRVYGATGSQVSAYQE